MVELDLDLISTSAGTMFRDILNPQSLTGGIPDEMMENTTVYSIQSILQAMGAEDAYEMVNVEQYEEEPEEEPEEAEIAEQKPEGQPLPEWPDEDVPITDEDVDAAIAWMKKMDPEIAAMLQAKVDEGEARG
ncbi:unnamed protein product [marine sediment metagenome]|uniref:Uncharacterized protein n=1 Tax=marine sediment metagenome TaxID=412755 RepID=X0ZIG0_9ZZZZ